LPPTSFTIYFSPVEGRTHFVWSARKRSETDERTEGEVEGWYLKATMCCDD
jgi:hypothetical protein